MAGGATVDHGELFSADLADDDLQQIELAIGNAGVAVVTYLKGGKDGEGMPSKYDTGLRMFGMPIAKASAVARSNSLGTPTAIRLNMRSCTLRSRHSQPILDLGRRRREDAASREG